MQAVVDGLRMHCQDIKLEVVLQTNGLLLDSGWLSLFERNSIRFGLSLDGPAEFADHFRVRHDGTGCTQDLLQRIANLRATDPLFERQMSGVLCVVNPLIGGDFLVRWFVEHAFLSFDFLLPDGNYATLPPDWDAPGFEAL